MVQVADPVETAEAEATAGPIDLPADPHIVDGVERAVLVQRLDQFIVQSIIQAIAAIPPLILLSVFLHKAWIGAFALLCIGQSIVYAWARGRVKRLELEAAVTGIAVGMWGIGFTVLFVAPKLYPFVPLLGLWPVILALPYIGGRFLLRFIFLSTAVEIVLAGMSLRSDPFPLGLPSWLLPVLAAVVVPALTTLISIIIWQYSSRLNETLAGLRTANGALRESERLLEAHVVERTAELATANAAIKGLNEQLKAENLRLSAELEITRRLQEMVLPRPAELEQTPGLEIATYMQPATEVGGDYYDVLQQADGRTKIGIGDVTGHGLESGVLMLMVQMAVRTLLEAGIQDPKRFLDILNRAIWGNVQRMGTDCNLSLALLDYQDGQLRLSGQHEMLLVARDGAAVQTIDTMDLGFPVGLVEEIGDFISHIDLQLVAGDTVVLYSDGIVEAENPLGNLYGLERLCRLVDEHRTGTAPMIKEGILTDLRQFIGNAQIFDDITLIVLKQR